MSTVIEVIKQAVALVSEGMPVFAKQFLHVGSRAAVDQALTRLCRQGELFRAARGLYVRPVQTRFGVRPPSAEKVVEALGEKVMPSGAATANALGLTTQVPSRTVFLTKGRSRKLRLGAQEIELRQARSWELNQPNELTGRMVRVLDWMGEKEASRQIPALRQRLGLSERQALKQMSPQTPSWMAKVLNEVARG